jgi:hypothetical protein
LLRGRGREGVRERLGVKEGGDDKKIKDFRGGNAT